MKEVLVFGTNFIGLVEITDLITNDIVMVFKGVKSRDGKEMDIVYFNDLEYGVVITDKIAEQLRMMTIAHLEKEYKGVEDKLRNSLDHIERNSLNAKMGLIRHRIAHELNK